MPYVYVHNKITVGRVLFERKGEVPVVLFDNQEDAKAFPELIPLQETKTTGLMALHGHFPVFVIGDLEALVVSELAYKHASVKTDIPIELAAYGTPSVASSLPKDSSSKWMNQTWSYEKLVQYFSQLFQICLEFNKGKVINGKEIDVSIAEFRLSPIDGPGQSIQIAVFKPMISEADAITLFNKLPEFALGQRMLLQSF